MDLDDMSSTPDSIFEEEPPSEIDYPDPEDDDLGILSAEEPDLDTTAVFEAPPVIKIEEDPVAEVVEASDNEAPPTLVPPTPVKAIPATAKPVDPRKTQLLPRPPCHQGCTTHSRLQKLWRSA
jgi:hypothetical protein